MAWDAAVLAGRRSAVLTQLRQRWGTVRQSADEYAKGHLHYLEGYFGPFMEVDTDGLELAPATLEPTEAQIRSLLDNLRAQRREQQHPLQLEEQEGAVPLSPVERRDIMAEITSAHFRANMQTWLGAVNPEHELSSTPLEELEAAQREANYRLGVLKQMVTQSERETDALELQIRAKRAAAENAAAERA